MGPRALHALHTVGHTKIFELGDSGGQGGGHRRTKENCCYRTFNRGKLPACVLAVTTNDRKYTEIQHSLFCSVFTHFVDGFSHKIYAATVDRKGREETYNFFSRRLGAAGGRSIGHRRLPCHPAGTAHVAHPIATPMDIIRTLRNQARNYIGTRGQLPPLLDGCFAPAPNVLLATFFYTLIFQH